MRHGAMIEGTTVDEVADHVESLRADGYDSAWLTDAFGFEPLTILAVVGRSVPDIELGTAVVRTHPRHPMQLAQQALTVNAAIGGRLTLGIGPSHRPSIERQWGISFDHPVRHVRDYVAVLGPLLAEGSVDHDGPLYSAHATLHLDAGRPCPLLLGALGPAMVELAGGRTDGTITTMTGPRTLRSELCPAIRSAADRAERPSPRVVAMLPVCVTGDVGGTAARLARGLEAMAALPSYAAAIEREGGVPLVAGSAGEVEQALAELAEAGVTDLVATRAARRGSDDDLATRELLRRLRQPASTDSA